MSLLLLALALAATPPAPVQHGRVYYYRSGVFAGVARVRGMGLAPGVAGYASTPDCGKVDPADPWVVYAAIEGGPVRGYEVLDCSQTRDLPHQRRLGLILEVNYQVAVDLAAAGHPRLLADGKTDATITGYGRLRDVARAPAATRKEVHPMSLHEIPYDRRPVALALAHALSVLGALQSACAQRLSFVGVGFCLELGGNLQQIEFGLVSQGDPEAHREAVCYALGVIESQEGGIHGLLRLYLRDPDWAAARAAKIRLTSALETVRESVDALLPALPAGAYVPQLYWTADGAGGREWAALRDGRILRICDSQSGWYSWGLPATAGPIQPFPSRGPFATRLAAIEAIETLVLPRN